MLRVNKTARVSDSNGFKKMFAPGQLTLGVFFPIEAFERDEPTMRNQERLALRAEELSFAALWVRDVPLRDPSFGDIGQVYDPWVYLGWIAAQTHSIALAIGSIILPVRHPLHTAKAAASIDQLSGGRLALGVALGDRPVEFPAFGIDGDNSWSGDELTVYNSTQWVLGDQAVVAAALVLPLDKVHILAPFVGGMFGSKVMTGAHTIVAALASIRLERPVKVVLSRQQVLTNVGHRTETVQRMELGATRDGKLVSMRHHTQTHTAVNEVLDEDEFREPTSLISRLLYACPNYEATHECVRLHVMKPAWMRAPGEVPCQWALENAMDELAYALKMDPVELRRRNHTEVNPHLGKPFSSKHILACYERGAERFG